MQSIMRLASAISGVILGIWNDDSPTTVKGLREERQKLAHKARAIVDKAEKENRDLTAEEDAEFKAIHDKDVELRNRIERAERMDAWQSELNEPADNPLGGNPGSQAPAAPENHDPQEQARNLQALRRAFNIWGRHRHGLEVNDQDLQIVRAAGFSPNSKEIVLTLNQDFKAVRRQIKNAMESGSGAGSHLSDLDFIAGIERNMLFYSPMLQVADIIRTTHGNAIPWPTFDDTSNSGAYIDEATADGTQDASTGSSSFGAFKLTSKFIKVSYELLEDSMFDIITLLEDALGERLGRKLNTEMTTGTSGAAKILGWLPNATVGKTAASATAITADELLDLKYSVDRAYRPFASWQVHDTTILAMKKLKDSNGQYLWQGSLATRNPDTFDGDPVMANNDVSQIATGNNTVGYGNFSKYKGRQVNQIRIKALTERWGDEDVTGFGAYIRFDGKLLSAGTDPVKVLQQA